MFLNLLFYLQVLYIISEHGDKMWLIFWKIYCTRQKKLNKFQWVMENCHNSQCKKMPQYKTKKQQLTDLKIGIISIV